VTAKHIRLYRDYAKCRDLARMIDTLRQRLMDMAMECGDRAREAETPEECRRLEHGSSTLAAREAVGPLTLSIKEAARALCIGR